VRKNCRIGKTTLQPVTTFTTATTTITAGIFYMGDNSNSYSETGVSLTLMLVIAIAAIIIGFVILLVPCLVWYKLKLRKRQQQSYAKKNKLILAPAMPLQGRL